MTRNLCVAVVVAGGLLFALSVQTASGRGVDDLLSFHSLIGFNCVHPSFIRHAHHVTSADGCAASCNRLHDCQAFSVADGACKMFVFNKCSKNVRECLCNRLTRVFVKKHPGLRPGALCPADFRYNRCGVKYKFVRDINRWDVALEKCSAESGLVIMAEPINLERFNYLIWLYDNKYKQPGDVNNFFWGGSQDPGSAEPAGGWHWTTCRIPIAAEMWNSGEPNNGHGLERYACMWRPEQPKLGDCPNELPIPTYGRTVTGAFCECASPFD